MSGGDRQFRKVSYGGGGHNNYNQGGRGGGRNNYNNSSGRGDGNFQITIKNPDGNSNYGFINHGNGQGYKQKRERDEDNIIKNDGSLQANRPPAGGGGYAKQHFAKKPFVKKPQNMIEHIEPKLADEVEFAKLLLTRLGDYVSMESQDEVTANIEGLAEAFISKGDIKDFADEISDVFIQCISNLSMQGPIYSTLIAMIYKQDINFPALIVSKLNKALLESLDEDNVSVSKLILRSIASLASCNCINVSGQGGLVDLLTSLLSVAQGDGVDILTPEREVATFLLASTMPYCAVVLGNYPEGIEIRSNINAYLSHVLTSIHSCYDIGGKLALFHVKTEVDMEDGGETVYLTTNGPSNAACWDTLYESCVMAVHIIKEITECSDVWTPPTAMVVPWVSLKEKIDEAGISGTTMLSLDSSISSLISDLSQAGKIGFRNRLCKPVSAAVGTDFGCGSAKWLRPRFSIFSSSESSPEIQKLCELITPFERYLITGYYHDIIHFFEPFLRPNGTKIGTIETMCKHLVAVSKLFPVENQPKLEYLLVETLFQLLIQNPIDKLHSSTLYRVMLDLCKNDSFTIPIAICMSNAFVMIPEMDTASWHELARWLSFHLVNTKLSWPYWEFFDSEYQEAEDGSPTKLFCNILIDKCTKSSLDEKVKDVLPVGLHCLVKNEFQPICNYFLSESMDSSSSVISEGMTIVSLKLREMLEQKDTPETIEEYLDEVDKEVDMTSDVESWKVCLLLQTIFNLSGVTLSDIVARLERYSNPIRVYSDSKEGQAAVIQTLIDVYGHDQAIMNFVLDAMLRRSLITIEAAGEWISSPSVLSTFTSDPWKFNHAEIIIDRSIDMVRAATSNRMQLGGDMRFDSSIDDMKAELAALRAAVAPIVSEISRDDVVSSSNSTGSIMKAGDDDEDDNDEGSERRGGDISRNDSILNEVNDENAFELDEDPVIVATDAVIIALSGCRSLYSNLICALLKYSSESSSVSEDELTIDPITITNKSLFQRLMRSFIGAEISFHENNIVITNNLQVESFIQICKDQGLTNISVIESLWNSFTN